MNRILPLLLLVACMGAAPAAQRDDSAAEALGWKLALKGYTLMMFPVFDQLDICKDLGVKYYEINLNQALKAGNKAKVDPGMSAVDLKALKEKFAACGVKPVSCGVLHKIPADEAGLRKLLEFLKDLGVENLGIEEKPTPMLVKLSVEIGIKIAIHNHPKSYPPEQLLAETKDLPPSFGSCSDVGHYTRAGLKAPDALRQIGKRVIQLHLKDVDMSDPKMSDIAFNKGQTDIKGCMAVMKEIGFQGVMTIEYDKKPKEQAEARATFIPQLAGDVAYFDQCAKELSK